MLPYRLQFEGSATGTLVVSAYKENVGQLSTFNGLESFLSRDELERAIIEDIDSGLIYDADIEAAATHFGVSWVRNRESTGDDLMMELWERLIAYYWKEVELLCRDFDELCQMPECENYWTEDGDVIIEGEVVSKYLCENCHATYAVEETD